MQIFRILHIYLNCIHVSGCDSLFFVFNFTSIFYSFFFTHYDFFKCTLTVFCIRYNMLRIQILVEFCFWIASSMSSTQVLARVPLPFLPPSLIFSTILTFLLLIRFLPPSGYTVCLCMYIFLAVRPGATVKASYTGIPKRLALQTLDQ